MSDPTPQPGREVRVDLQVTPDSVDLDEDEASIVAAEAAAAADVLPESMRSDARALADVAESGTVPGKLVPTLEHIATSSLTGGRARRLYRAEGEKLLNRVLLRTPRGRDASAAVAEVNTALAALAGRELHGVRVTTRIPGSHTLRIEADGVALTLGLSAAGVVVENVTL